MGGTFGGSRFGVAEAELAKNLQESKAKTLAQLNLQNFAQAQANVQNQLRKRKISCFRHRLTSSTICFFRCYKLNHLGAQDVNQLLGIGGLQQQFAQQQEDIRRRNILEPRLQPYQQLGFLSDIYQGAPTSAQVINTAGAGSGASPLQQAIGVGIGALSGMAGLKKLGVF